MIKLKIIKEVDVAVANAFFNELTRKCEKTLAEKGGAKSCEGNAFINLVFCGDSYIHKLNRKYRGKDSPTDVLSFAYWDPSPEGEGTMIGEIVISATTAKKQAKEKGHDLNTELGVLFVHGVLHLFEFDHESDEEEEMMERFARKILK